MVVVAQSRWTKIAWFIAKPWLFVGLLVALFGKVPLSEALDWDRFTHTRTFLGDYRIFLAFIVAYVVIIGVYLWRHAKFGSRNITIDGDAVRWLNRTLVSSSEYRNYEVAFMKRVFSRELRFIGKDDKSISLAVSELTMPKDSVLRVFEQYGFSVRQ